MGLILGSSVLIAGEGGRVMAARVYADLWARLSRKEIKVGAHNLIIAATAMSMGFFVATLDRRYFEKVEGLDLKISRVGG